MGLLWVGVQVQLISPLNGLLLLESEGMLLESTASHLVRARLVAGLLVLIVGAFEVEVYFRLRELLLADRHPLGCLEALFVLARVVTLLEDVPLVLMLVLLIILIDTSFLLLVRVARDPHDVDTGPLLDLQVCDLADLHLLLDALHVAVLVAPAAVRCRHLLLLQGLLRLSVAEGDMGLVLAALAGLLGRLRRVGVGRLNSLGEDQLVADDAVVGEVDAHGDVVEATVDVGWACVDLLQLLEHAHQLRHGVKLIVVDRIECRENPSHLAVPRHLDQVDRPLRDPFEAVRAEAECVDAEVDPLIRPELADGDSRVQGVDD